jgi:dipeptidyl aminopeptidase/acylaminoacyl peptidase
MKSGPGSLNLAAILLLAILACAPRLFGGRENLQQQNRDTPLRIEDAMKVLDLSNRTFLSLSPDGAWVAYTVEDNSKRATTSSERYAYYTPTGAFTEAIGCDIWIANTTTKESRNLTEGKGTSWAPVWSPDGKYLAFYSDRSGTAGLWVWEKASGEMKQLSDDVVRPFFNFQVARWTPDSQKLIAKTLPAGQSVEQAADLLYGPVKKGSETEKPENPAGVTATVLSFVPPPAAADKGNEHEAKPSKPPLEEPWMNRYLADLTLFDVKTGKSDHIIKAVRPLGYWVSPDGKMLAYTHWKGTKENTQQTTYELRVFTFADGSTKTVVPELQQEYGISVSWAPDGKSLAYTTAGPLTKGDCYVVSLAGGEPQLLTSGDHPPFSDEQRAPLWDGAGQNLYLISSENYGRLGTDKVWKASVAQHNYSVVGTIPTRVVLEIASPSIGGKAYVFGGNSLIVGARDEATKKEGFFSLNVSTGKTTKLFEDAIYLGRDVIFGVDVSNDGKTIVYVSQDAQHPEDIWATAPDFKNPTRVSTINRNLENVTFGRSQVIDYYSVDGEHLHGALLLPANYEEGKKYPLIVDPYGGSYRSETVYRFGLSGAGVENLQILATRGYAALLPDTPMHGNNPMSDLLKTVIPAVDRVVELGIADPDRLGVMGHSYGGYSTLSLIVQTTRFKAAVDSAGPGDLVSDYAIMDEKGSSWAIGWAETGQGRMGGTPWEYRERYIENSPFYYLDRVQTPLLIIQGGLDTTVPRQQADAVFVALRRLNKEVTYANYAGEDHWEGTWGQANVLDYWNRVIDWFDKHMKVGATGGNGPGGK